MPINNLWVFNAAACFALLTHMVVTMYTMGVLRPLEKRFGLSAVQSSAIMIVSDSMHTVLVLLAGYFFRRAHKPRVMGIATGFIAIGATFAFLPYFMFPQDETTIIANVNSTVVVENPNYQICEASNKNATGRDCSTAAITTEEAAYAMIMVGQIFQGIASAPVSSLGMAYVYENTSKNKAFVHIGILSSMYAVGPIIGLSLASGALGVPENNVEAALLTPDDPRWVGAWYLGFIIVAGLAVLAAIPLLFLFPRRMPDSPNPIIVDGDDITKSEPFLKQVKDFFPKLKMMFSNAAFTALMFSFVSGTYVVFGVFVQLPRYLEIQFHQPLWMANIISAVSSATAGAMGNLLCGFVMMKLNTTVPGCAKYIMCVIAISCIGDIILMVFSCPQTPWAGQPGGINTIIDPQTTCAVDNCFCDREKFEPICADDGVTYFSPCHGGCSGIVYDSEKTITQYTNCTCMGDVWQADPGMCAKKNPCPQSWGYAVVLFIVSFVTNSARVPATILVIRLIGGDNSSFVIAMQSFLTNLLGLIPAPIMFGAIIDSLCILKQMLCGEAGTCYVYDVGTYRWLLHGISLAFLVGSLILTSVVWWLIRFREFPDGDALKDDNEDKVVANGKENLAFEKQEFGNNTVPGMANGNVDLVEFTKL